LLCAQHYTPATYSDPYGFFSGIWHGIISPFSLIANLISWVMSLIRISVFTDIQIIGRPNTGFLFYYIGFLFGLSIGFLSGLSALGGSGTASSIDDKDGPNCDNCDPITCPYTSSDPRCPKKGYE